MPRRARGHIDIVAADAVPGNQLEAREPSLKDIRGDVRTADNGSIVFSDVLLEPCRIRRRTGYDLIAVCGEVFLSGRVHGDGDEDAFFVSHPL